MMNCNFKYAALSIRKQYLGTYSTLKAKKAFSRADTQILKFDTMAMRVLCQAQWFVLDVFDLDKKRHQALAAYVKICT